MIFGVNPPHLFELRFIPPLVSLALLLLSWPLALFWSWELDLKELLPRSIPSGFLDFIGEMLPLALRSWSLSCLVRASSIWIFCCYRMVGISFLDSISKLTEFTETLSLTSGISIGFVIDKMLIGIKESTELIVRLFSTDGSDTIWVLLELLNLNDLILEPIP